MLTAVGGPWVLSAELALWTLPLTVLSVVWVGWTQTGASAVWFLIAVIGHLVMVLLGLAVYPWLMPKLRVRPDPRSGLTLFAVLGLARGLSTAALVTALGLPRSEIEFLWRPIGGAAMMVITASPIVWAIDGRHRQRQLMAQLSGLGAALTQARNSLTDLLDTDRRQILDQVDQSLTGPLESLRNLLGKADSRLAAQAAAEIDQLVVGSVKPLSRRLGTEVRSWQPEPIVGMRAEERTRSWPATIQRPLLPEVHALAIFAISPAVLSPMSGLLKALAVSALTAASLWLVGTVAERLRARYLGPLSWWRSVALVAAVSVVTMVPIWFLLAWPVSDPQLLIGYRVGGFLAVLVAGLVLAAASAIQQVRQDAETEVRNRNAELAVEVARVSSRLWLQQSRIAQLMRGPLQDAFLVALARVTAADRGEARMPPAAELLAPIDQALADLGRSVDPDVDLIGSLDQLRQVWSGVLRLDIRLDAQAAEMLAADVAGTSVLVAVIRELVNNAYQHGRSREVTLDVRPGGDQTVQLTVASDGQQVGGTERVGLGTRLLDATAITWRRITGSDGVQVQALFPVGDDRPVVA